MVGMTLGRHTGKMEEDLLELSSFYSRSTSTLLESMQVQAQQQFTLLSAKLLANKCFSSTILVLDHMQEPTFSMLPPTGYNCDLFYKVELCCVVLNLLNSLAFLQKKNRL